MAERIFSHMIEHKESNLVEHIYSHMIEHKESNLVEHIYSHNDRAQRKQYGRAYI